MVNRNNGRIEIQLKFMREYTKIFTKRNILNTVKLVFVLFNLTIDVPV